MLSVKQVLDGTLNRIAEAHGYHERAPEYGERAWRVRGRFADIVYWDVGNGWCDIIDVIPHEGCENWLRQFFAAVEGSDDE